MNVVYADIQLKQEEIAKKVPHEFIEWNFIVRNVREKQKRAVCNLLDWTGKILSKWLHFIVRFTHLVLLDDQKKGHLNCATFVCVYVCVCVCL